MVQVYSIRVTVGASGTEALETYKFKQAYMGSSQNLGSLSGYLNIRCIIRLRIQKRDTNFDNQPFGSGASEFTRLLPVRGLA